MIAARITGRPLPAKIRLDQREIRAEMDMIKPFFFIRDKEWQGLKLDNVTFVLNAVDELAGEDAFLALRSRQARHRTLTTVEASTNTFKESQRTESAKADEKAKKALDDVQKKLQDEVDKIANDKTLDPGTQRTMMEMARQNMQRELDVTKANIENQKKRTVKEIKDTTEREVRVIENRTRVTASFLPPILVFILGIIIYSFRVQRERQGIVPDRLVHRKS